MTALALWARDISASAQSIQAPMALLSEEEVMSMTWLWDDPETTEVDPTAFTITAEVGETIEDFRARVRLAKIVFPVYTP